MTDYNDNELIEVSAKMERVASMQAQYGMAFGWSKYERSIERLAARQLMEMDAQGLIDLPDEAYAVALRLSRPAR